MRSTKVTLIPHGQDLSAMSLSGHSNEGVQGTGEQVAKATSEAHMKGISMKRLLQCHSRLYCSSKYRAQEWLIYFSSAETWKILLLVSMLSAQIFLSKC